MRSNRIVLAAFLLGSVVFIGCDADPRPSEPPVGVEHYHLPVMPTTTRIATEFDTYMFLSGETRPVYVGGFAPDTGLNYAWVVDHVGDMQTNWPISLGSTTTNAYYGSSPNYEYTAPLDVTAPHQLFGSYTYRFHLGDIINGTPNSRHNTTASIRIIVHRTYAIEYSCMGSTYDLRNTAYQFPEKLTDAFGEANTIFWIDNVFNANMTPVTDLPDIHTNQVLIDYGDIYATGNVNHDPNIVVLFGMRDHTDETKRTVYGVTAKGLPSPRKAYAFVFGKRIDDTLAAQTPQDRQVSKTRVAIHELGHARGKDEYTVELGEQAHFYHQGRYKGPCVMKPTWIYETDRAFHFCEHHKQLLLNITW